ncbi:MAG: hypothetical protein GX558_05630, partial [Clostridiales bacterium]|nr:hypothetical protein [Clostridiales bacterium]
QLADILLGRDFLKEAELKNASPKGVERLINDNVDYMLEVYGLLGYDAFGVHYLSEEHQLQTIRRIRQVSGWEYMVFAHADGTFAIPDGDGMVSFAYRIADDPDDLTAEAEAMCVGAIERNRRLFDAGCDGFILCSDYCFNQGPFLSPAMFRQYITPYLTRIIAGIRDLGGYAIKHTDGDIMPILDQLVEANPHALHSLDPMAGVDIAVVKKMYGDKVALLGNVNCALMQTGTEEQVVASAEYCLTHAKPGGGYVFCTSNIPFRGLPLERYQLVLDVWKRMRDY